MFFKDDPAVQTASLTPAAPIAVAGTGAQKAMSITYNRIGGLLNVLADLAKIPVEAALAVWQVESGGEAHHPGQPIIRFENHKYFKYWGQYSPATFDAHFQYGGRAGVPGSSWKNHRWRPTAQGSWQTFHGDQQREYDVFHFAKKLGDDEAACLSISIGGAQILGSNHTIVGYSSAKAMFDAMAAAERWEVCGFFDFCRSNNILDELRREEWEDFAEVYNGSGQAVAYGQKIETYFDAAENMPIHRAISAPPIPQGAALSASASVASTVLGGGVDPGFLAEFTTFVSGLGLRHFKPYELLTMGHQHSDPDSPAFGLNAPPPRALWPNIIETVQVLDGKRGPGGTFIGWA
ncbi:N-acetylmuramidase domain-containing protein [Ancylobacter sp. VNQ12]|uniref:N-acetylmuramidase domain-containing protein n=1 Tax=Ancylobacter sp. VNQ12 TaxID=3400920 RepID=UPI003C12A292